MQIDIIIPHNKVHAEKYKNYMSSMTRLSVYS